MKRSKRPREATAGVVIKKAPLKNLERGFLRRAEFSVCDSLTLLPSEVAFPGLAVEAAIATSLTSESLIEHIVNLTPKKAATPTAATTTNSTPKIVSRIFPVHHFRFGG